MSIYKENILDHYENPRNFGHLDRCDIKVHDTNPVCGDAFDLEIKISDNRIQDLKFSGHGCAISVASASMLSEKVKGKKTDEVEKLKREDIMKMLGIELSHARIKCAMLPLKILKLGIYQHIDKK